MVLLLLITSTKEIIQPRILFVDPLAPSSIPVTRVLFTLGVNSIQKLQARWGPPSLVSTLGALKVVAV